MQNVKWLIFSNGKSISGFMGQGAIHISTVKDNQTH